VHRLQVSNSANENYAFTISQTFQSKKGKQHFSSRKKGREAEKGRETERQRDRETERQRGRNTEKERGKKERVRECLKVFRK
jgi:hypothetical protein